MPPWITQTEPASLTIAVKAVPGAKRSEIVGTLGDRLKIRVAAPPEGGKANKAICALLAKALDVRKQDVSVLTGASDPHKAIRVQGVTPEQVVTALNLD